MFKFFLKIWWIFYLKKNILVLKKMPKFMLMKLFNMSIIIILKQE